MPYVLIRGNLSSYSHKYPFRVLVSGLKGIVYTWYWLCCLNVFVPFIIMYYFCFRYVFHFFGWLILLLKRNSLICLLNVRFSFSATPHKHTYTLHTLPAQFYYMSDGKCLDESIFHFLLRLFEFSVFDLYSRTSFIWLQMYKVPFSRLNLLNVCQKHKYCTQFLMSNNEW